MAALLAHSLALLLCKLQIFLIWSKLLQTSIIWGVEPEGDFKVRDRHDESWTRSTEGHHIKKIRTNSLPSTSLLAVCEKHAVILHNYMLSPRFLPNQMKCYSLGLNDPQLRLTYRSLTLKTYIPTNVDPPHMLSKNCYGVFNLKKPYVQYVQWVARPTFSVQYLIVNN